MYAFRNSSNDSRKALVDGNDNLQVVITGGSISIEATAEFNGASINATVTNWAGASGLNINLVAGNSISGLFNYRPTTASRLANVVIPGETTVQLCSTSSTRQMLYFENCGLTTLWYGLSASTSTGPTGLNIGQLSVNESKGWASFSGALYGTYIGVSNADVHVVKVFEY